MTFVPVTVLAFGLAIALIACAETAGIEDTQTVDPSYPAPIKPDIAPSKAPSGAFSGEMTGRLLGESTYRVALTLSELPDGSYVDNGTGTDGANPYQLWDLNLPARAGNIPHYDGFATGKRDGSEVNLSLRLNYKACFLKLKAYLSTDAKTLNFFAAKQTVNCGGLSLPIALKPFTLKQI
jgi:hypothetical protein